MESIYKHLGVIIGYTVIILIIQNILGEKAGESMVLFTLFSMLILNSEKVVNSLKSFQTREE